jgi:hypothetical protein
MCSEQSFYVIVIKAWWSETLVPILCYICVLPVQSSWTSWLLCRSGNSQGGSEQTNGRNVPCPLSSPANTNPATIRTFQIMGTPACSLILCSIPRRETHNNNRRRGEVDNKQDYTQSNKEIDKVWKKWFYQEYQGPPWDVPSLWVWFREYVCTMYHVPPRSLLVMSNEQPK